MAESSAAQAQGTAPPEHLQYLNSILARLEIALVQEQVSAIKGHLDDWGETVGMLTRRDSQHWELVRIQMEHAVRRFHCPRELYATALQEGLTRLLGVLVKIDDEMEIEAHADVAELVYSRRADLTNAYCFTAPIYAFAKRIAHNALINEFRRLAAEPVDDTELSENLPGGIEPDALAELEKAVAEQAKRAQVLQARICMANLLALIQLETPKPRAILMLTLAARPHFWSVLKILNLSAPADLEPLPADTDDEGIAAMVKSSANSVRVQRSQALARIKSKDAILGQCLERLLKKMDAHTTD